MPYPVPARQQNSHGGLRSRCQGWDRGPLDTQPEVPLLETPLAARRPLKRATRWDCVAPMILNPGDGSLAPSPAAVAEIVGTVGELRESDDPFDVVITRLCEKQMRKRP